ncbi:MAG: FAD binding domain-containing protein [Anaerolineae bacterium]|jgi:CO/xanthine dehydrogenase FAD-binding subunit|nr:hypothetical protein [Chloroflexota bacterium]
MSSDLSQQDQSQAEAPFVAASVEEALAFLAAHRGQAQVLGAGTTLLADGPPTRSGALPLVDVSRIAELRRVLSQPPYVVLGGAVALAQLEQASVSVEDLLILADVARYGRTHAPSATLAGDVMRARGNSAIATALIALSADAQIANLTGSQWVPVRSLLLRAGACRVNSQAEVLVSFRIRSLMPLMGAALAEVAQQEDASGPPDVAAATVSIDQARNLISSLTVVLGIAGTAPMVYRLSDLDDSRSPAVETVRRAVNQWAASQAPGPATEENVLRAQRIANGAQEAFDKAVQRARLDLANSTP